MTERLLLTPRDVRGALAGSYGAVLRYDRAPAERARTAQEWATARRRGPHRCAACGETKGLDGAHIVAIEECGRTEPDNLLPLCSRRGAKGREAGCHRLFDAGYASVAEMQAARRAWLEGRSTPCLREKMEQRWLEFRRVPGTLDQGQGDAVQSWITRGALRRATKEAERLRDQSPTPEARWG